MHYDFFADDIQVFVFVTPAQQSVDSAVNCMQICQGQPDMDEGQLPPVQRHQDRGVWPRVKTACVQGAHPGCGSLENTDFTISLRA